MISTVREVVGVLLLLTRAGDNVLVVRTLMIVRRAGRIGHGADLDLLTISMPSILGLAPTLVIAEIATHAPTVDLR